MMAIKGTTGTTKTNPTGFDWATLRGDARLDFQKKKATFGEMRGSARNAYQDALANILTKYTEGFSPMVSGYGQRGLLNSGIYSTAVDKYAADQIREAGAAQQALRDQLFNINKEQAAARSDLNKYLDQIKLAKKVNMMNTAGTLNQAVSLF